MGSDNNGVQQPTPPQAPTQTSSLSEYIANYPRLVELQGQYAPVEAQQQLDMLRQYGTPMAEQYKSINEALYPETAGLQENLSAQARIGMEEGLSPQEREQYRNTYSSELGTNAGSPIGADYMSANMMNAEQQRKDYYRNLAITQSGKQPLASGSMPTYNQISSGYSPSSALGYSSGIYGTNASIYNTQYGQYGANAGASSPWQNMLGQIGGSMMGNMNFGSMFGGGNSGGSYNVNQMSNYSGQVPKSGRGYTPISY